jgi:UDP-MurNAc hydroxylase
MTIKFLNHASFLVEADDLKLVLDPWFKGSVFNNGWDLLYQSSDSLEQINPNAIWISHEHPDHFNIPTLTEVPLEQRRYVTIYVRETIDKRIVNWCSENGFSVIECEPGDSYQVGSNTSLRVFPNGIEDSALLLEHNGLRFLNLNDCIFSNERALMRLAKEVGSVDFVGYLWGYAEGGGTPENAAFRLERMTSQIESFRALKRVFPGSQIVGFAAFKYFSHVENFFQNDQIDIRKIRRLIDHDPNTYGMVKPGDELSEIGREASLKACDFWENCFQSAHPVHRSERVFSLDELESLAAKRIESLREIGRLWLLVASYLPNQFGLKPLEFRVDDQYAVLKISLRAGVSRVIKNSVDGAVKVSSEALHHALSNDFGLSTLLINGRFTCEDKVRKNLYRWSVVGLLRASSQRLSLKYFVLNATRILSNL